MKIRLADALEASLEIDEDLEPIVDVVVAAAPKLGKRKVTRDEARLWLLGERLLDDEIRWLLDVWRRSARLRERAALLQREIRAA